MVLARSTCMILAQISSSRVPSTTHVLLDVHATSIDQQNAVAYRIASSHEDLHEVTSISSCVDLNSQNVS